MLHLHFVASIHCYWQDSNGLELMNRSFVYSQTDPVPGNFFPAVASAVLQDTTATADQFTILFDRAHGVGNHGNDGSLDVMLHRRCLYDDGCGSH